MPFGQHLARCMNCGKTWIVGDCIPAFCSEECQKAHTAWWNHLEEWIDQEKKGGAMSELENKCKKFYVTVDDGAKCACCFKPVDFDKKFKVVFFCDEECVNEICVFLDVVNGASERLWAHSILKNGIQIKKRETNEADRV